MGAVGSAKAAVTSSSLGCCMMRITHKANKRMHKDMIGREKKKIQ